MQFTDTGSKLHHQHIRASTAERIPGFLQCCKVTHMFSFSQGIHPAAGKTTQAQTPSTGRRESNDQFWQSHMTDTAYRVGWVGLSCSAAGMKTWLEGKKS